MSLVLVVEDEPRIADSICDNLKIEGYFLSTCSRYEEILPKVRTLTATQGSIIIVLDRLLFGRDSIELIDKIRTLLPNGGLIVLSAINSATEKAFAMERGADDYLAKPFAYAELLARIRALERRVKRVGEGVGSPFLSVGNLILDTHKRSLLIGDQRVTLTNKEFLLLKLLLEQPGRVFNRTSILEFVWEINADVDSNVVESTVNCLRRKLEDFGASGEIKNMRNAGYWFET